MPPHHPDRYKWVALSNTTLGMLMATINSSIILISLPGIFRGIGIDPLSPGNVGYLLWLMMGYMLVTAVLVVSLGRLGDMLGRVKIYNAGFAVFSVASIILALDPMRGGGGALWLVLWRLVQGVGGAMLFANSSAIIVDAFPARPARPRDGHQPGRRDRRLVHRTHRRRPALRRRLAAGLLGVGARRRARHGLGLPLTA